MHQFEILQAALEQSGIATNCGCSQNDGKRPCITVTASVHNLQFYASEICVLSWWILFFVEADNQSLFLSNCDSLLLSLSLSTKRRSLSSFIVTLLLHIPIKNRQI